MFVMLVCVCIIMFRQKDDSEKCILEQWFSQSGPKTSSSSATWKLLEMPIFGPHPDLLKWLSPWVCNCCNKPPKDSDACLSLGALL